MLVPQQNVNRMVTGRAAHGAGDLHPSLLRVGGQDDQAHDGDQIRSDASTGNDTRHYSLPPRFHAAAAPTTPTKANGAIVNRPASVFNVISNMRPSSTAARIRHE